MANITQKEFGRRFRKALSVPFMLNQACSSTIQDFIKSYAAAVGCNEKCVLFPLLSCVSACIGPNSCLELSQEWKEVPIVWTLTITPMTLYRINVAEHIKNQLLIVQNELFATKTEDCDEPLYSKFLVDLVTQEDLHEMLVNNSGQALGIYSSTRPLEQLMVKPESEDIMLRLHAGSSWFTDNTRRHKKLLNKTQVNFAVLASPSAVCNSLKNSPCFAQIYQDCFLTVCAEENHIKFSQLKESTASDKLKMLFKEIINIHLDVPVVYKLNEEATARFAEIHDAISDKAKQIARKNPDKVFHPAISYIARITCVLHVLENVLDSLSLDIPIEKLTWNCEIVPDTVWRARQLLGYVIEQKYSLAQPTMVPSVPTKAVQSVTVFDGNPGKAPPPSPRTINSSSLNRRVFTVPSNIVQQRGTPARTMARNTPYMRSTNQQPIATPPRRGGDPFDLLLTSRPTRVQTNGIGRPQSSQKEPLIVGIASAGLPVPVGEALGSTSSTAQDSITTEEFVMPSMSVSCVQEPETILPTTSSLSSKSSNSNSSAHTVALMTNEDFFQTFNLPIRRFLVHDSKEISLVQCIQMKFAPKPSVDCQDSSEQRRALARIFLKRIETLGFGTFEAPNGVAAEYCIFRKKNFASLTEQAKKLLRDMKLNEWEYNKCFERDCQSVTVNNVVCLE